MPPGHDSPLHRAIPAACNVCEACGRPFLVPLTLLGETGAEECIVAVHCANCGELSVGVHDDAAMEALDRETDEGVAMLREALVLLELVDQLERVDRFAEALQAGHILPEDF